MNKQADAIGHLIESGQVLAAPSLEALLQHQGDSFVDCAYMTLLGRSPDTTGNNFYLTRLRMGVSKIQILSELARSPEARARNYVLPGLAVAIGKYRLATLPLIGRLFGMLFRTEGNSANDIRLRIVEQQLFALSAKSENRLARIEDAWRKTHELLARQRQQGSDVPSTFDQLTSRERATHRRTRPGAEGFPIISQPPADLAVNGRRTIYFYVGHTVRCITNTGMQRVARRLARSLLAAGECIRFVKWDSERDELVLVSRAELEHFSKWNGPTLSPAEMEVYSTADEGGTPVKTHAIEKGNWLVVPEVTYITFNPAPVTGDLLAASRRKGLRSAFVYYDTIPLRRAEHSQSAAQHEIYTDQLLLADLVVPISQWVATDLGSFFRVHDHALLSPTPRIAPILLPAESQATPRITAPPSARARDHLILSVGTIEVRKNQIALVHAFEVFSKSHLGTDWQLILVGNLHPTVAPEIARAVAANSNIRYLHHVSDENLDALYRQCAFTVFPSVEEGFGLPILESLWYARPCICANFGAMGEVGAAGGCLTIDTHSEDEILKAVQSMIESPELIDRLSGEAVERRLSDWSDYAMSLTEQMDAIATPIPMLGPVFYWVDHTRTYQINSGIQRVVRGLADALIKLGVELIPVKWDSISGKLAELSSIELQHLARWNGPSVNEWSKWRDPIQSNGWVLVPELTTYLPQPDVPKLRDFVSAAGLRAAWIFHDAIPSKMDDVYPPEEARAHRQYMSGLNRQELVLAISHFSYVDLITYLGRQPARTPSLFERIFPCPLPAEFTESPRVLHCKESRGRSVKILCVGTVEPRKNHLTLLEAFIRLKSMTDVHLELVIAGGASGNFPALAKSVDQQVASEPAVRWVKSPSDDELCKLYLDCDFTVYPSSEEGFGLPIVESLWHARPCVCASFGAMAELAENGGCVVTDVRDASQLSGAMLKLVDDLDLRRRLGIEATKRQFKTWKDYAMEVALRMATERPVPVAQHPLNCLDRKTFYTELVNLKPRPSLSICITTYNRAAWLDINLRNLMRLWPEPHPDVEFVVCDNTSTDNTSDVVSPYLARSDFRYIRNAKNVGMLGNLRVTTAQAQGEYVWILGDDDLVCSGSIERVLNAIHSHTEIALLYLNYAYTRLADASAVTNIDSFLAESTPIVAPGPDRTGSVREICAMSENFFTAIYCLIFRRDHALRAYSQNTDGRPFSSLLTCIPTTYYVLNFMFKEPALWIGSPVVVVNMNVSWMKYAPLWILERIPEAYDLAERLGANRAEIDRWRLHNLPGLVRFLEEIFENDPVGNVKYFSMRRLASRLKGLDGIEDFIEPIRSIYAAAHEAGHPAAQTSVEEIFEGFGRTLGGAERGAT